MNIRFGSIALVVTIVSLSSGCGGMQNFLFGRGSRCGLCNFGKGSSTAPQFGNTMQAPCTAPACGQPLAGPVPSGGGFQESVPYIGGEHTCGTCGATSAAECGCGSADPYTSAPMVGPGGQVIAPTQGDNFSARRFDNDGSRILWEEPAPSGTSL